MGALSNSSRKAANLTGFYKVRSRSAFHSSYKPHGQHL